MLPASLIKLIDSFSKLPGVGRKTAQRFAYFLLRSHGSLARDLGDSLVGLHAGIGLCQECFMLSDGKQCTVCNNPQRDRSTICVVEHIFDAEAIERSQEYHGVYHILHGRIAPLDNMLPDDIKIDALVARIERLQAEQNEKNAAGGAAPDAVKIEIILATNPSSEGETTALYIQRLLKPFNLTVTRIATGIPVGADLEYADEVTLGRAMKGRQNYE